VRIGTPPDGCIVYRQFRSHHNPERSKAGLLVGFDFTGDALYEIDRFRWKEGREIKPLTVREILNEELAR
jgi:hypothetical protein